MNSHVQLTYMDQSPCSLLFGLPRWSAGYSCLFHLPDQGKRFRGRMAAHLETWQHWCWTLKDLCFLFLAFGFKELCILSLPFSLWFHFICHFQYCCRWFSSWLVCHKEAGEFVGLLMQNKHFITGHTLSSVKEIRRLCHVRYYWVRFSPTWQKCHIWYC